MKKKVLDDEEEACPSLEDVCSKIRHIGEWLKKHDPPAESPKSRKELFRLIRGVDKEVAVLKKEAAALKKEWAKTKKLMEGWS